MQETIRIAVLENGEDAASQRLTELGYEVHAARSYDELEQTIKRFEPQVVLVDLELPAENRTAFAALKKGIDVPVPVLLYGDGDESALARFARESGADGWISKTWDPETFRTRLDEHVHNVLF